MSASVVVVLATLGFQPVDPALRDRVDLIEINHFFDDQGRLVFDQIIFYDWSPLDSRFQVRDWRMLKRPAQLPRRDWGSDLYIARWHDGKQGDILRVVESPEIRQTWTQYDPELVEREFLPEGKRRKLHQATPFSKR